jgi:hypothetical protein
MVSDVNLLDCNRLLIVPMTISAVCMSKPSTVAEANLAPAKTCELVKPTCINRRDNSAKSATVRQEDRRFVEK